MEDFGKVMSMPQDEAKICLETRTCQGEYQGIPVMAACSTDYVDASDVATKVVGHCEMFNLSKEEDRKEYADLLAKLSWSANLSKYLEERVFINNELIVYIAYLEYMKIA